jgi:hypothetical protein
MLWSVADRFKFGSDELMRMKISRLRFWYQGVEKLYKADAEAMNGK